MKKITDNRKLNTKERFIYRKEIETLLRTDFKNKKVKISKDLLEQLLFEEIVLNEKRNIVIKLPIWSGEFLQQIDLSEVDFSNVSWAILYYFGKNNTDFDEIDIHDYYEKLKNNANVSNEILDGDVKFYKKRLADENKNFFLDYIISVTRSDLLDERELILNRIKNFLDVYRHEKIRINYSGTNANIDLSKSFEANYGDKVCVSGAEFRGCNIFMSKENKKIVFYDSDFSASSINLPKIVEDTEIAECSFENCNLSKTLFDVTMMVTHGINLNNLNNSGAKIIYKNYNNFLKCFFMKKYLNGCYKTGELINTKRI